MLEKRLSSNRNVRSSRATFPLVTVSFWPRSSTDALGAKIKPPALFSIMFKRENGHWDSMPNNDTKRNPKCGTVGCSKGFKGVIQGSSAPCGPTAGDCRDPCDGREIHRS